MAENKRSDALLAELSIEKIVANKHNPRLIFRAEELEELAESIQDIGVKVPISVYRDGDKYVLIDGERRWRACRMINRKDVPAIVYPKPSALDNIVFMFNIHRFRRDWDPLPTAMKLEELIELDKKERGEEPTEAQLAALTGMSRGAIRRCRLILEIPKEDRNEILDELEKPEHERRVTTDLFIEAQRSVKTVHSNFPNLKALERPLRAALVSKYKRGVIVNVVHMRLLSKITRAAKKGVPKKTIERVLNALVEDKDLGLEDAYRQVAWAYDLRTITTQAKSLDGLVSSIITSKHALDKATRDILTQLSEKIREAIS